MATSDKTSKVSFKDTLNLPRTDFPIRPQAADDDPKMLARWEQEELYAQSMTHNLGAQKYILHDGPPYANGHLHLGHAFNKVLKDIVTKAQRMMGRQVPVVPGWDCHGLPIELKVTSEQPGLSRTQLQAACRAYARNWIDIQRAEFKRLGVVMDWENPYLTMDFAYEADIVRCFGKLVEHGYIERKNKTVPWCPSCQTVLASAEIEYQERKDPSLYVLFTVDPQSIAPENPLAHYATQPISFLIWTTTPWTLPLNRAVMIKPNAHYALVRIKGKQVIIGADCVDRIAALVGEPVEKLTTIPAEELLQLQVQHPFETTRKVSVVANPEVSLNDGTACVHCAPGCGPEDYEIGVKNHLEIYSPVDAAGRYTSAIVPEVLAGVLFSDVQGWVITQLLERDLLLHKSSIKHSYPHCWRCRNGLIFRATKQWFCNLEQHGLKERVLSHLDEMQAIPEKSMNRLRAAIGDRLEWCLSRQRVWGAPIPALICDNCDHVTLDKHLINTVANGIQQSGIEFWTEISIETLPVSAQCGCGNMLRKETDILDVWFDSGISHYAVLKHRPELQFPADIYLEGKDQHRGWFQSSILTSFAINQTTCVKLLMTHGFTVDEQGRKMSKSIGNVVSPAHMIEQLGTDGLRLWTASIDASAEAVVSDVLIRNVQEVFRKVRNTCRFLLSNLYDYDHEQHALSVEELLPIDAYALSRLSEIQEIIIDAYNRHDHTAIFHALADYCSAELSAWYLDIIKDRLYTEFPSGAARRSAQTVCWYILDTITRLMAPILSFTAEQVSDHYQKNKTASIHLQPFADLDDIKMALELRAESDPNAFEEIKLLRSALLKAIERLREQGIIKHSLEARIVLYIDPTNTHTKVVRALLDNITKQQSIESFLQELCIISQVALASSSEGLLSLEYAGAYAVVEHALGTKCPRCWQWQITNHPDGLCDRCAHIVQNL